MCMPKVQEHLQTESQKPVTECNFYFINIVLLRDVYCINHLNSLIYVLAYFYDYKVRWNLENTVSIVT
jgi:hypothetical protein